MAVRDTIGSIRRNPAVMAIGGLVVLALGAYLILRSTGVLVPAAPTDTLWYFDLGSSKVFAAKDQFPPIEAPSGPLDGKPAGVRARLFACGECSADPSQMKIGWLETFTPEFRAMLIDRYGAKSYYDLTREDRVPEMADALVKSVDADKWIEPSQDRAAAQKVRDVAGLCGGEAPRPCDGPRSR